MRSLTYEELFAAGGHDTRCGTLGQTLFGEAVCAVAGGFIGFGLTGANFLGAITGARYGFTVCALLCHWS